jgi:hypothetical protein
LIGKWSKEDSTASLSKEAQAAERGPVREVVDNGVTQTRRREWRCKQGLNGDSESNGCKDVSLPDTIWRENRVEEATGGVEKKEIRGSTVSPVKKSEDWLKRWLSEQCSCDGRARASLKRGLIVDSDEHRVRGAEAFEVGRDGVDDAFDVAGVEALLHRREQEGEVSAGAKEVVSNEAVHDFTHSDGANLVGRRTVFRCRRRDGGRTFRYGNEAGWEEPAFRFTRE